jgi:hypothetical protein
MAGVFILRAVSTFLYFQKNGIRSSYGGDIWFFMGVAQGHERLFWSDPLQYVLPLFRNLSPEHLFDVLLVASNIFHLVSVALLFLFCLEMTKNVPASLWAAAVYSVTMTSFNFSTASFHHQQAALPLIVGCLWISWRIYSEGFTWIRGLSLMMMSLVCLSMGPDILVILALILPLGGLKLRKYETILAPFLLILLWGIWMIFVRNEMSSGIFRGFVVISAIFLAAFFWFRARWQDKKWVLPFLLLGIWVGLFCLAGPWMEKLFEAAAAKSRGIDLAAQRMLRAEDLMPFELRELWIAYPWIAMMFIGILIYSWKQGRFFEGFVVFTSFLFAGFAARFYFLTEIGFALVIAWFFSVQTRPKMLHGWGSVLVGGLIIVAVIRGVACLYPGIIWGALEPLRKEPDKKLVLCTPTYGFLVKSLTGHKPTSDWHHLNGVWIRTASRRAEPALVELKRLGVHYAFFTSIDLRVVEMDVNGVKVPVLHDSGGFELPSVLEDVQATFAFRVLYGPENMDGLTMLRQGSTRNGESKAVLARLQ